MSLRNHLDSREVCDTLTPMQTHTTFSDFDIEAIRLTAVDGPDGFETAQYNGAFRNFGELRGILARAASSPNNLAYLRQRNQGVLVADMWTTDKYTAQDAEKLTRSYANEDGMIVHEALVVTLDEVDTHIVFMKVSA